MNQARGLLADRLDQARMAVADAAHGNAGECIEVALALFVPQPAAFAALEGDRQALVGVHDVRHGVSTPKKHYGGCRRRETGLVMLFCLYAAISLCQTAAPVQAKFCHRNAIADRHTPAVASAICAVPAAPRDRP